MTAACASLSLNVESMHQSLIRINTDYLTEIADQLNLMQNASQENQQSAVDFSSPFHAGVSLGQQNSSETNLAEKASPLNGQSQTLALIQTLLKQDESECQIQTEDQRYVEQKLLHQNLKNALNQESLCSSPISSLYTCLAIMLYAKDDKGRARRAILKGIQMIVKRQCKLILTEEKILQEPLQATYEAVFKLVTVGISDDTQLSEKSRKLLQSSIELCKPLTEQNQKELGATFKIDLNKQDTGAIFKSHKEELCQVVKQKFVQLQENMSVDDVLSITSLIESDPMTSCLITLDQTSW